MHFAGWRGTDLEFKDSGKKKSPGAGQMGRSDDGGKKFIRSRRCPGFTPSTGTGRSAPLGGGRLVVIDGGKLISGQRCGQYGGGMDSDWWNSAPGSFSMLGVGVSFALAAKLNYPDSQVVFYQWDGAFLSGGLSVEAAFPENAPITVVIDNKGIDHHSQQQERLFGQTPCGHGFPRYPLSFVLKAWWLRRLVRIASN
ncbi:MAG: hypothetical protein CM1200mP18_23200 [Gammaproteobacteria bacterium]|nr:MAG: hypothetical protein CM1200mP18_23200 [Gammaproteobacteria bacterium]